MRGLLIKDAYTIVKQTKVLLLITVIFAVVPSDFLFGYSVFYAAMMPITGLAYDERAKWDKLAGMLPYSVNEIVGSKYLMGYISVGIVFLLTIVSRCCDNNCHDHVSCTDHTGSESSIDVLDRCRKRANVVYSADRSWYDSFYDCTDRHGSVHIFHRRKISDRRGGSLNDCLQCDFLSDFEKNLYEKSLFIKKSSSATPFAKPHLRCFFAALRLLCS